MFVYSSLYWQAGALSDHVLLGPRKKFVAPYTKRIEKIFDDQKKKMVDAIDFQSKLLTPFVAPLNSVTRAERPSGPP